MRRRTISGGIVAVCLSLVAAGALAALQPSVEAALISAIAFVCVTPLATRLFRRRLDIFEPILIANLALVVMYVGRPAAMLVEDSRHVFKGYDITSHMREALVIALIGAVALQIGYWSRSARRVPALPGSSYKRWDITSALVFSALLAALAVLLFGTFLLQSGGPSVLTDLISGRSAAQDALFRDSSAYLYAAPSLLWPASLLLFAVGFAERRRDLVYAGIALMIPLAVFAGGQGSRITLLPLLLAPGVLFYLSRGRRPAIPSLVLVGYLVFTIGIAYFRDARTADAGVDRIEELKRAVTDPAYEYRQLFIHGVDNDMYESLAAVTIIVPERLAVSPMDFAYRTIAKPVPSAIWSGKPVSTEERITRALYPREEVRASSSAGIVGTFFVAGGLPGVFLGMLALGWVLRVPWDYWRRFPSDSNSQLVLAAFLMFIPIVLRGGLGDTLARALFGILPLLIAVRICRRPHRSATSPTPYEGIVLTARAHR